MSNAATVRTHNLANVDITDLTAIRETVANAAQIGHWRRILAIYGDHLPKCKSRFYEGIECDCGWDEAFQRPDGAPVLVATP